MGIVITDFRVRIIFSPNCFLNDMIKVRLSGSWGDFLERDVLRKAVWTETEKRPNDTKSGYTVQNVRESAICNADIKPSRVISGLSHDVKLTGANRGCGDEASTG